MKYSRKDPEEEEPEENGLRGARFHKGPNSKNTFITGCEVNGKMKQQQEEDLIGNLEKDE